MIVTGPVMVIDPEVRTIVPVSPGANVIRSGPGEAFAAPTELRKLPGPLSLRLVTVNVCGEPVGTGKLVVACVAAL